MRPQIGHFLQYLSVERGASPHTLKGYREDLHALAEYLSDGEGHTPAPGSITTNELRGFSPHCTKPLCEDINLATHGFGPQLHYLRPARRLGQIEPAKGSAIRARAASCRTFSPQMK